MRGAEGERDFVAYNIILIFYLKGGEWGGEWRVEKRAWALESTAMIGVVQNHALHCELKDNTTTHPRSFF